MNDAEYSKLTESVNDFADACRRGDFLAGLAGRFEVGKMPHLHVASLEDGSTIGIKFVNTVKHLIDSKLKQIPGRESYLSYYEISGTPFCQKTHVHVFNVKQVRVMTPRIDAAAKHAENLDKLRELATSIGINLDNPESWSTVYSENHKQKK